MQVTRKAAAQRTAFGTGKPIAAIRRAPVSVRAQAEPSKQDGALDMTRRQLLAGVALSPLIIVKGAEAASNIKYLEVSEWIQLERGGDRGRMCAGAKRTRMGCPCTPVCSQRGDAHAALSAFSLCSGSAWERAWGSQGQGAQKAFLKVAAGPELMNLERHASPHHHHHADPLACACTLQVDNLSSCK